MPKQLKFIHITDTHLLDDVSETFYGINTKSNLEAVLYESVMQHSNIDFILITGDISQTGRQPSYLIFKSIIQSYSIPIYCVPGNHDSPTQLHKIDSNSPTDSINVINLGKTTLVLINSCIENEHYGSVSNENLEQLKTLLNNKKEQAFIIALHHPPIEVNSKWLDRLNLQNRIEFLNFLKHYQKYFLVLFGHVHQEIDKQFSNMHFISTPSTCHQFKPNSDTIQCTHNPPPAYRVIQMENSKIKSTKIHFIK